MSYKEVLEQDHREIDRLYAEALELLAPATKNEGLARLDLFWARLAVHIRAEHHHLFPAVTGLGRDPDNSASNPLENVIADLRHDHDLFMRELASAVKELRLARETSDPSALIESARSRLERVGQRLAEHNRIEEDTIYSLEDLQSAELLTAIESELANLPPRFSPDPGSEPR